ncbi:adenylosuccinate lyase [Alienimonas californiensis]|uniref:Adenylosuccinate lyase n=1 Tax=Alienimonas californiensis TaxID=2527989 RepID=A0A517P7H1_9PLAN|nr:adenylosuccinate lyase [Alienimonas californiensis]QDT15326.1 Adenylosuccinate lyase [Alienimonas californiensis]
MSHDRYENPLLTRYASDAMAELWSARTKHGLWRRLWLALAESQQELGLDIPDAALEQMRASLDLSDDDFALAAKYEMDLRHDVMAHVHAWGEVCPDARPIIHLGATSCFVTDNAELIQTRRSLELVRTRLVRVIDALARFAEQWADEPCLGFTHLQPAQPTTVGKRATLWCQDLCLDLEEVEHRLARLKFRGVKGTTGTQATFLQLFGGDGAKVDRLDELVREKMDFAESYAVTGQTYPRKVDAMVLATLSGVGQSCHKAGTDLRILQHRKELEEPQGDKQIGSSAMAYKRNPMRAERMCGLARFAMSLAANGDDTAATQWLERTLDDSANRRLSLPQSCLAIDACLLIYANVAGGLLVYPKVIAANLASELPFMATEAVLMAGVEAGGDRQDLHERVRVHSRDAGRVVKEQGEANDLIARLQADDAFAGVDLSATLDPKKYIGRAPEQTRRFVEQVVGPIRERYADALTGAAGELKV